MSYTNVSSGVEDLLLIVCGNEWPTGDTGQLRSDADVWRSVGQGLADAQQAANTYAQLAEEGLNSSAGESFSSYWNTLTSGSQPFIPLLAQVCGELADSLDEAANQIETVRIGIVASVIALAIELAWDAAMAFFTAGASMELAAEQIAATRLTIINYIRRAAIELAEHEIKQTALQFIIDLIAQGIGKIQHPGGSINMQEAGYAAVNGAVGGAVGFGAGMLFKGLGMGLSELDKLAGEPGAQALDHLAGMFKEDPAAELNTIGKIGAFSGKLVGDVALNVATGPAEAAAQDAALNNGQVSQSDPQAGAMNGIGNGAFRRIRKVNPGDEPLDLALKKTGELLGNGFQNIKNAIRPYSAPSEISGHPAPESIHATNPDNASTHSDVPSHAPAPTSPVSSDQSLTPQNASPVSQSLNRLPPPHIATPPPTPQAAASQNISTLRPTASTPPPSQARSIHRAAEYTTAPPSPVLSHAQGLPDFAGQPPALTEPLAIGNPAPAASTPASNVLNTMPDSAPPAVQSLVVSPGQGGTQPVYGTELPPAQSLGLTGFESGTPGGMPPTISGLVTNTDGGSPEAMPSTAVPPAPLPSAGQDQKGDPPIGERGRDHNPPKGLPGL